MLQRFSPGPAETMKTLAILGSTGSIGRSTLSIVEQYPDRFRVLSLAAGSNVVQALEQAKRWKPQLISMATAEAADQLQQKLNSTGCGQIEIAHGITGAVQVATHPEVDFVVSAIVGVAGLEATF